MWSRRSGESLASEQRAQTQVGDESGSRDCHQWCSSVQFVERSDNAGVPRMVVVPDHQSVAADHLDGTAAISCHVFIFVARVHEDEIDRSREVSEPKRRCIGSVLNDPSLRWGARECAPDDICKTKTSEVAGWEVDRVYQSRRSGLSHQLGGPSGEGAKFEDDLRAPCPDDRVQNASLGIWELPIVVDSHLDSGFDALYLREQTRKISRWDLALAREDDLSGDPTESPPSIGPHYQTGHRPDRPHRVDGDSHHLSAGRIMPGLFPIERLMGEC